MVNRNIPWTYFANRPFSCYRHPSHPSETNAIIDERRIESGNPASNKTYYTTEQYDDPDVAKEKLSLRKKPSERVGPVYEYELPQPIQGPSRVQPLNGEPGGGTEVIVTGPVFCFGLLDMDQGTWETDL